MNRRTFIQNTSMASVAATVLPAEDAAKKQMMVHQVYFWLKNPANEADKAKLIEGLETLLKIPVLKMVHIGTPAPTTDRAVIDSSYGLSWLCIFNNVEDEAIYQKHPIHTKFVADYAHLWQKVVVYDAIGTKKKLG
jgi:Stress responsive A/B Barrel Domain